MSFGKRTPGQAPPAYTPPPEPAAAPELTGVRTRVANPGAIDRKFIGLAAGVVVLSAGGAIAAPSLILMIGGTPARPIEQVIAGLDRSGVRDALAREAFPDDAGRAFMTSLAAHFPQQHDRLLDQLADAASAGADRDGLFLAMNAWTMEFAPGQLAALGRTGAEGFDRSLGIFRDALGVVEAEAGGCTLNALERYMSNPANFNDLTHYGGEGYRVSMRAGATMIDLAARGRDAPPVETRMTPDDEIALRSTFMSMLSDPQVMNLIQAGVRAGTPELQSDFARNINVCQLARTVIVKLEGLPAATKARLFATVLSSDFGALGGFLGSPYGPSAFNGARPKFGSGSLGSASFGSPKATQFFP